jgi:hypothetical protein
MYAGFTLSVDTVTVLPRTWSCNVLSVRDMTLCGPLYGGSNARRAAFCLRKTCVDSFRSLCTNVAGEACRVAGTGRSCSILRRSW